jgi:predicted porin
LTYDGWLNSDAAACPLSAFGLTLYGALDVGGGYETHAARFNGDSKTGVMELITKVNDAKARWQGVPSGLSQSNIGVKMTEVIAPDWLLIGDVNAGFDPFSLNFANGPKSLVDNNNVPQANQTANTDSARSTGFDNSRGYVGLSNKALGVLTLGRQGSLSYDVTNQYDPFAGSYAFSALGFSSTFAAGTGDTETSHYNMSIKYGVTYQGLHAGALTQLGGFEQGNNALSAYQFDVGGGLGGLSVDAVYASAKDAVTLSNYTSGAPTPDTLKATLANVSAGLVASKYRWRALTVYGGYSYAQLSSPSNLFGATATTTGGTLTLNGGYPAVVQANPYVNAKIQQVGWVGGKYKVLENLEFYTAYYYISQNNYTNASTKYNIGSSKTKTGVGCGPNLNPAIPGSGPQGSNAAACPGDEQAVSAMLDWRIVRRIELYTGVMYSAVTGGLANGFIVNTNAAFTTGVRIGF